jgi:hypothetical protein
MIKTTANPSRPMIDTLAVRAGISRYDGGWVELPRTYCEPTFMTVDLRGFR